MIKVLIHVAKRNSITDIFHVKFPLITRFIHGVICISSSILFIVGYYSIMELYHNLFINLHVNGYLGYFQFGPIKNSAATNTLIHVFWWP